MPDSLREDIIRLMETQPDRWETTLRVSEVFGPTIQGEGPYMGRPCHFIRLGGCNLSCDWCDTPYSTGTHGIPLSTVPWKTTREIINQIPPRTLVVLTGGEPLMHTRREAFQNLVLALKANGNTVHVETNGTTLPQGEAATLIDHYTVSPKVGVNMVKKAHTPTLANWADHAHHTALKTVWDPNIWPDVQDFITHTLSLADTAGINPTNVWTMPEGATADQLAPKWAELAQAAADHNINASHRLHALAWGDAKGH